MAKIIYDKRYNFHFWGLEKLHPFQADKFRVIYKKLLQSGRIKKKEIVRPEYDKKLIENYLSENYRKKLTNKKYIGRALEMPFVGYFPYCSIEKRVLIPMLTAACGTVLGARQAIADGLVVNLGGGFHHAGFDRGGGFCLYPDVAIAVKELRKANLCDKIAIVDCDAHQGDGTEYALGEDSQTLLIDVYDYSIFPGDEQAKQYIDIQVEIGPMTDKEYCKAIGDIVLPALKQFAPELIIYCAGTDIYQKDPLSRLRVSAQGIILRDHLIISHAREKKIPLLMLLSGGYHKDSADIVADSILQNVLID